MVCTELIRRRIGTCEHGNVSSSSTKGGESLDKLRDYQFLKSGLCSMKLISGSKIIASVECSRNVSGISQGKISNSGFFPCQLANSQNQWPIWETVVCVFRFWFEKHNEKTTLEKRAVKMVSDRRDTDM
jgi:hypothetical protein